MGRRIGSVCRLCRREGVKLFLKGTRCVSGKCSFDKRGYSPGQHGKNRIKLSDYGLQMREKQKVKRIYGMLEKQFRLCFEEAERQKGVTGEVLLQLLERRLDNFIFHCRFTSSRAQARQLVRHGFVTINDRKVNIPSCLVKKGEIIRIKANEKQLKKIAEDLKLNKDRSIPEWIRLDEDTMEAAVLRLPERPDIGFPVQEQLIVELYSK